MKKLLVSIVALGALIVSAQEKKKAAMGGILHPEMEVKEGTYEKPMATIGSKESGWSGTTTAAGVGGKPQPGHPVTVVGEVVDFSCYLQLGKHGDKHRDCGQKCVRNGQAAGLLTKDGSLYMLMPEEHDPRRDGGVDARPSAADHMGHIIEVHGIEARVGGYRAIYVAGLKK